MKQKLFLLLAAIGMMVPQVASAYDFEVDGIYYNTSGNSATVTSGSNKYSDDVNIPATVTDGENSAVITSVDEAVRGAGDNAEIICHLKATSGNAIESVGYIVTLNGHNYTGEKTVSIPSGIEKTGTFSIDVPMPSFAGDYDISVAINKVNGVEVSPSSATGKVKVLTRTVLRNCVFEGNVAASIGWCPRSLGVLEYLKKNGNRVLPIAIHQFDSGDPMSNENYAAISWRGFPDVTIDRKSGPIDPYSRSYGAYKHGDDILSEIAYYKNIAPLVDVSVTGSFSDSDNSQVAATAKVEYLTDCEGFTIAYVLTADSLTCPLGASTEIKSRWKQYNHYASYTPEKAEFDTTTELGRTLAQFCQDGIYGQSIITNYVFNDVMIGSTWNTSHVNEATPLAQTGLVGHIEDNSSIVKITASSDGKRAINYDKVYVTAIVLDSLGQIVNAARAKVLRSPCVVTATSADSKTGSVTGSGSYDYGSSVTLTAIPAEGYTFAHWSNGEKANPYTFTATQDSTLTALFKVESETLVGFSNGNFDELEGIGTGGAGNFGVAIAFNVSENLDGAILSGVSIPFKSTKVTNVRAFVATELGSSAPLAIASFTENLTGGYNSVLFDKPIALTNGEKLYIGYTFAISQVPSSETDAFPILIAKEPHDGGLYLQLDGNWTDYSKDYGCSGLMLHLSNLHLPENSAVITSVDEAVRGAGGNAEIICHLKATSGNAIESVGYIVTLNGHNYTGEKTVSIPSGIEKTGTFSINVPMPSVPGDYDVSVAINKVNGVEVSPSSATGKVKVLTRTVQRNCVFEELDGCSNLWTTRGLGVLEYLKKNVSRVLPIALHQYDSGDPMYNNNYATISWVGSPNVTIDRKSGPIDPYYSRSYGAYKHGDDILSEIAYYKNIAPLVDVSVTGSFSDSDNSQVAATAKVEYLTDCEGFTIAYVLTADSLTCPLGASTATKHRWEQYNNYASYTPEKAEFDTTTELGRTLAQFCQDGIYGQSIITNYVFNDVMIGSTWNTSHVNKATPLAQTGLVGHIEDNSSIVKITASSYGKQAINYDKVYVTAIVLDSLGQIVNAARAKVLRSPCVVTATSADSKTGSVTGSGSYDYGSSVTLTAIPAEGYTFAHWSNGETANPYTFIATQNSTLTATFNKVRYSVMAGSNDEAYGTVTGSDTYEHGTQVTLTATSAEGYIFEQWSNGETANPYTFTATQDSTLMAIFVKDSSGHQEAGDTDISEFNDVVYISPFSAIAGQQATLSIKMRNSTIEATGFQCDIYLPEGASFVTDEDGFPCAELSTERTSATATNYFQSAIQSDGALRILCNSTIGVPFGGTDGEVATVPIVLSKEMADGSYPILIKKIRITEMTGAADLGAKVELVQTTMTTSSYLQGDANGDGEISVNDLSAVANNILGRTSLNFNAKAADVNGDGEVSVNDLSGVAYYVLYNHFPDNFRNKMRRRSASSDVDSYADVIYVSEAEVTAGQQTTLSVNMKNSIEATGYQCDIYLPEGLNFALDGEGLPIAALSTSRTSAKKTDFFQFALQPDGALRILCNSTGGYAISGNDGEVATVSISADAGMTAGSYDVIVRKGELADATGFGGVKVQDDIVSAITVKAAQALTDVDFDFTDPASLGITPAAEIDDVVDITAPITKGAVTATVDGGVEVTIDDDAYILEIDRAGVLTLSTTAPGKIVKVEFGDDADAYIDKLSATTGELDGFVWTGSEEEVVFEVADTRNAVADITTIKVWLEGGEAPAEDLTFTDGEAYTATAAVTYGKVTYTRTFSNTNWQALYVPFSIDYDEWSEKYDIAEIHNFIEYDDDDNGTFDRTYLVVLKKTSGSTEANYPYLIRAKETGTHSLVLSDKTLEAAESNSIDCRSVKNEYTFTGTYTTVTDMYANQYWALSGGALNKANAAGVTLNPQRWYMALTSRTGGSSTKAHSIRILVDGEDDVEGICEFGNSEISKFGNVGFDLTGRMVSVKDNVRGVNIVNGKKLIK